MKLSTNSEYVNTLRAVFSVLFKKLYVEVLNLPKKTPKVA